MIDLRSNSISLGIFVFFWFGIFVSGGFVSRGRSQTPAQNGGKNTDRFDDGSSSGGYLIDNALRALSRHWLECYFNKTAKYDSVHIQARRLFSFETYDVSENDKLLLKEADKGAWRLPILQNEYKDKEIEESSFNPDFTNIKELATEEKTKQNIERSPEETRYKTSQNERSEEIYRIKKRMRRDVFDSILVREGIMKITDGIEWTDDFLNKSSRAYQQVEEIVLSVIDSLFKNGPISSYFYGSYIKQFKKGSVIVLFSIEFKNDTNITHSDETINTAFHQALLNASAFTNLTLDVNNSKIGNLDPETTTRPSTTTELATSSTSEFLSESPTSIEVESTTTDNNIDSTTTQQPIKSSTSTDVLTTNTQFSQTSTSEAAEAVTAGDEAESTSDILPTLSTTSTINEISTEEPGVITSSEEPSTTISLTTKELYEPPTSQTNAPLATSTEGHQSTQIIESTTRTTNSATTPTAKSSTTTKATTEAILSTPAEAHEATEISKESTETSAVTKLQTTTTSKEPHVSTTAPEVPIVTISKESIVSSSTTEVPISTISIEQPVTTTAKELPTTTSIDPPLTTSKTEVSTTTQTSESTTTKEKQTNITSTDPTFTTNLKVSTTTETSETHTTEEEQTTTTSSESPVPTLKIEVSTTTPPTYTPETTTTKEELPTTTSPEPHVTTSKIEVSTTAQSIETPETTTIKEYQTTTISSEPHVTTSKTEVSTTKPSTKTPETTTMKEDQTTTTSPEPHVTTLKTEVSTTTPSTETTTIKEDQTTTTSPEPHLSTSKTEVSTTAPSTESPETTTIKEDQTTTTSPEPHLTTSKTEISTTTPSTETPETTTIKEDQTTTTSPEPRVTTSKTEVSTTTPSTETPETTTLKEDQTTTTSSEPLVTTSKIEVSTTTPSSETPETTTIKEDQTTTTSSEPLVTTSNVEVLITTPSTETLETTIIKEDQTSVTSTEPPLTTSIKEMPTSTPFTETPKSSLSKEDQATKSSTESPETTTKIEELTTTSSIEQPVISTTKELPTSTSSTEIPVISTLKEVSTTPSSESPGTMTKLEVQTITTSTEPPVSTTKIEVPTTTLTETPETTTTIEIPTTTPSTETPETTTTIEIPTTTPSTETPGTSTTIGVPTTTTSTETQSIKLSTTTTSTETPETTTTIEVPTNTPSAGTPETTTRIEEPTTTTSIETPNTTTVIEVPTTTSSTGIPETTTWIEVPTNTPSTEPPSIEVSATTPSTETPETTTSIEVATTTSTETPSIEVSPITTSTEPPKTSTKIEEASTKELTSPPKTTSKSTEPHETTAKIEVSSTKELTSPPETTSKSTEPHETTAKIEDSTTKRLIESFVTTKSSTEAPANARTTEFQTPKTLTETNTATQIQDQSTTMTSWEQTQKTTVESKAASTELPTISTLTETHSTATETEPMMITTEIPTRSTTESIPTTLKEEPASTNPITSSTEEQDSFISSTEVPATTMSTKAQTTTASTEASTSSISTDGPKISRSTDASTNAMATEVPTPTSKDAYTTISTDAPTIRASTEASTGIKSAEASTTTPNEATKTTSTGKPIISTLRETTTTFSEATSNIMSTEAPKFTMSNEASTTRSTEAPYTSTEVPITSVSTEAQTNMISTEVHQTTILKESLKPTTSTKTPSTTTTEAPTTTVSTKSPTTTTSTEGLTTTKVIEVQTKTTSTEVPTTIMSTELPNTTLSTDGLSKTSKDMHKTTTSKEATPTTTSIESTFSTVATETPKIAMSTDIESTTTANEGQTSTKAMEVEAKSSSTEIPTTSLTIKQPNTTLPTDAQSTTSTEVHTQTTTKTSTKKATTTTMETETPKIANLTEGPKSTTLSGFLTNTMSTKSSESTSSTEASTDAVYMSTTSTKEAPTNTTSTEAATTTAAIEAPTIITSTESPTTTTSKDASTSITSTEAKTITAVTREPSTTKATEAHTSTTLSEASKSTLTKIPTITKLTETTTSSTSIETHTTTPSTETSTTTSKEVTTSTSTEATTSTSTEAQASTTSMKALKNTSSTEAHTIITSSEALKTTTSTKAPTAVSSTEASTISKLEETPTSTTSAAASVEASKETSTSILSTETQTTTAAREAQTFTTSSEESTTASSIETSATPILTNPVTATTIFLSSTEAPKITLFTKTSTTTEVYGKTPSTEETTTIATTEASKLSTETEVTTSSSEMLTSIGTTDARKITTPTEALTSKSVSEAGISVTSTEAGSPRTTKEVDSSTVSSEAPRTKFSTEPLTISISTEALTPTKKTTEGPTTTESTKAETTLFKESLSTTTSTEAWTPTMSTDATTTSTPTEASKTTALKEVPITESTEAPSAITSVELHLSTSTKSSETHSTTSAEERSGITLTETTTSTEQPESPSSSTDVPMTTLTESSIITTTETTTVIEGHSTVDSYQEERSTNTPLIESTITTKSTNSIESTTGDTKRGSTETTITSKEIVSTITSTQKDTSSTSNKAQLATLLTNPSTTHDSQTTTTLANSTTHESSIQQASATYSTPLTETNPMTTSKNPSTKSKPKEEQESTTMTAMLNQSDIITEVFKTTISIESPTTASSDVKSTITATFTVPTTLAPDHMTSISDSIDRTTSTSTDADTRAFIGENTKKEDMSSTEAITLLDVTNINGITTSKSMTSSAMSTTSNVLTSIESVSANTVTSTQTAATDTTSNVATIKESESTTINPASDSGSSVTSTIITTAEFTDNLATESTSVVEDISTNRKVDETFTSSIPKTTSTGDEITKTFTSSTMKNTDSTVKLDFSDTSENYTTKMQLHSSDPASTTINTITNRPTDFTESDSTVKSTTFTKSPINNTESSIITTTDEARSSTPTDHTKELATPTTTVKSTTQENTFRLTSKGMEETFETSTSTETLLTHNITSAFSFTDMSTSNPDLTEEFTTLGTELKTETQPLTHLTTDSRDHFTIEDNTNTISSTRQSSTTGSGSSVDVIAPVSTSGATESLAVPEDSTTTLMSTRKNTFDSTDLSNTMTLADRTSSYPSTTFEMDDIQPTISTTEGKTFSVKSETSSQTPSVSSLANINTESTTSSVDNQKTTLVSSTISENIALTSIAEERITLESSTTTFHSTNSEDITPIVSEITTGSSLVEEISDNTASSISDDSTYMYKSTTPMENNPFSTTDSPSSTTKTTLSGPITTVQSSTTIGFESKMSTRDSNSDEKTSESVINSRTFESTDLSTTPTLQSTILSHSPAADKTTSTTHMDQESTTTSSSSSASSLSTDFTSNSPNHLSSSATITSTYIPTENSPKFKSTDITHDTNTMTKILTTTDITKETSTTPYKTTSSINKHTTLHTDLPVYSSSVKDHKTTTVMETSNSDSILNTRTDIINTDSVISTTDSMLTQTPAKVTDTESNIDGMTTIGSMTTDIQRKSTHSSTTNIGTGTTKMEQIQNNMTTHVDITPTQTPATTTEKRTITDERTGSDVLSSTTYEPTTTKDIKTNTDSMEIIVSTTTTNNTESINTHNTGSTQTLEGTTGGDSFEKTTNERTKTPESIFTSESSNKVNPTTLESQTFSTIATVVLNGTLKPTNETDSTENWFSTTETPSSKLFDTTSTRETETPNVSTTTEKVSTVSTKESLFTTDSTPTTTNASTTSIPLISTTTIVTTTTSKQEEPTTIQNLLTSMVSNVLTTSASRGKATTLGVLTTTTTKAPTVIEEEDEVAGVIKIDEEFDQALLDPTSDAYQKKVAEILALLQKLFAIADISQYIANIRIEGFIEGSLIVKFKVAFISVHFDASYLKTTLNTAYYSVFEPQYKLRDEFTQFSVDGGFETILGQTETTTSAIDHCLGNPCSSLATCKSLSTSYQCLCPEGYVLSNNQCQDVNECIEFPCGTHFICNNTIGRYSCSCEKGFILTGDRCEDIDECLVNDACPQNSNCINLEGSYVCACNSGFTKKNDLCIDVNECEGNVCPEHSVCHNTEGSYICNCETGFVSSNGVCVDNNECLTNVCPENSNCENKLGSYICFCKSGFSKNGTQCVDIDECSVIPNPCKENSVCINTIGSFQCTCILGYVDTGESCKDINECDLGKCPDLSVCTNTDGSYLCDCIVGYTMENATCIDINECNNNVCPDHSVCKNTVGSYKCTCDPGYVMTKGICQDVNECINDLHSCPAMSTCMNTEGSYHCRCNEGYFQSGLQSCTESSIYNLDMRVQKVNGSEAGYSTLLNDSSTNEFKTMAASLAQVTDHVILDSPIHQGYLGTSFYMFEPGSIVSHGNLYYEPGIILSSAETDIFASNSTSAYLQYSVELTELNLTDVNECLDQDLNDCSEYANCTNTPGKYNCTCFSQYLDISKDSTKPGRICAAISDQNRDPIRGLVVEIDRTHYIASETAVFTIRLSRGSHVTYNISYGDGSTERRAYSEILSFLSTSVFTHEYTTAGMYNSSVLAVNDVSHERQSVIITVVDDIKNLNLTHTSTNSTYDGQKRFELKTPKTLRNIKVEWDFGNGFEQQKPMSVFSSSLPLTVDHYYSVGYRFVKVNISNERTNQVIEEKFYIEEKISGLEVTCSSYITEPLKSLHLKVRFQTGSNVTVHISYGDGNELQSVLNNKLRGEFTNYYPFVYSNVGKYNVSVRVWNTYSEMNVTSPYIYVETPINNLLLSTESVVALPSGQVKLLLSFTGSELEPCCMNCSTYIKGIYQRIDEIALIEKDKPTEISVVWQDDSDVGTTDIEVFCKNKLGNKTFKTWTTFQRKIEQVYISTSQTSIRVGGSISVKFDIGIGSHIQYQYNLGNGIKDSVNLPSSLVTNHSVSVTSSYQQMGVYEIKFNVSNLVSSVIKNVKVKVLEEIKGLKLSRYYKVSDLTETTHHGHGSDGDIFPLERPVIFEAIVSSGNEIIYTWTFGSENGYVTSDAKVMYKFQYVGSHLISVNVSNGLYFEYEEFNITLEEIVNPYSLKNNGPKMAFDLMTFTLKLSNPGTNPCYLWFMGDFSTIIIYGETVCKEKAALNNYEYRPWNVSNEIRHQHMYKSNGTFSVKVTGFNLVSSQSINDIGVITGVNCYYPIVHIIGGGQRIDEPVAMYRSEWINLESSAEINCPASSGPEYHWKIFKIQQGDTYLNRVFNSYEVSTFISTDHFKILFPPITFSPGLYRISLNVSMIGIPGMFSEHYTYLNITKTPLVVRISGGTARNIGYDSSLILNAYEMTYDPDSPTTSNFTYEWRCRKENEVYPSVMDYVAIPTLDEALNQTRHSGCFGTGIGKLPISSGIIKVSTLLLDPHSKNVFEVHVKKDTREGTFQQMVEVIEGDPPLIQILCVENCNSKMNPSSPFSVQGKCLSCNLYEKVEYKWSLLLEESEEFQDVDELDSLLVTDTKSSVLVFKSSTLVGGRTYRLRLSASVYGYTKSFTEYEFITNLPPYGGSCGINPTSGYALETEFIISCNDWVNPGEEESKGAGLLYRFWSKLRGRLDTQLLYYGTDPYTPDTKFPLGPEESDFLHDVVVRIANPIGEYVETWLSVKVSKPIIKNEVSELISLTSGQDSTLENLLSSGKTQEAKQVIVAVASLINTSPTEIGISRASVIKSNDKVISTTTTSVTTKTTTPIPGTTIVSSDLPLTEEYENITTVMPTLSSTTPKTTTLKITSTITISTTLPTSTEHLTTYIVGTTVDPVEVEAERQRKEEEEKKKRIQLRESLLTTLSTETTSLTLDSLQQTALCFRVVTHESSELSETSQDIAVNAMSNVANSFQKIVSQSQTDSTIQKYSAAEDILACLSSVIIAATGDELSEIQKINEKEGLLEEEQGDLTVQQTTTTTTTTTPSPNIGTTEAPGTTKSPEQIKLETKQKVRSLATKVFDVAEVVYKTIIQDRVPGEPPVVLESQLFTIVAERLAVNAVNNTHLDTSTGSFQMPTMDTILSQNTSYVDSKVLSSKTNPYVWDNSAKFINTPVLTLNLYDSEGKEIAVKNLNDSIMIDISVDSSKLKISQINFPLTSREKLSYHYFTVRSNMSSVHIVVKPEDSETKLECYVGVSRQPTIDNYDSNFTIPRELTYSVPDAHLRHELEHTIFLSPEYVQERGIGDYYLGVRPVYNETEEEEYPNYDDYYSDYGIVTPPDLLNYTISFVTSGCFYWDVDFDKWVSDGCQVSYLSNSNYTRCLCNHLTSFGSDFFVPPNTINFMTVFNDFEAKLRDNWAVLAVLCLMYFLYTVGLIWARYKDKRDVIKWGIAPLADNVVCDKFFYQLTVCTGMRRGAGTKSKISFVLAGETQDTGVRELIDEKGIKTCSRGSINNFVLSTSEWLGPLTFIRIWHDNSGEGKYQGWYLSKVIVTDLQTSETYCFLCNRWLAVEEDDGMVDRLLPVASKEDMTNFQNLFMTKTKKSFTDSHLWISVFSRPHRSTFTRVQRLSCILSLVMTTLMVNAMFYQAEDKVKNKEYLSFGPFEFSLSGIYISFVSSMIVLPINIIIDQLFRKSKPKRNRITNAFMGKNVQPLAALSQIKLRPWSPPDETKLEDYTDKPYLRPDSANSTYSMHSDSALIEKRKKNSEIAVISNPHIKPSKKKSKKFMLPHSCVYVAYTLVYISALLSSFITFLYSIEWGKEKSLSWLSSILLSICESVIVIQPFKIILVAMLLSIILKKPDIEEETETSEESQMNNQLLSDEELLYKNHVKSERPALKIEPPDKEKLAEAREKRMKEIAMFEIVREIAFYFVFVALIVLVASHNRDKKAYPLKEALDNIISINKVNKRSHVPDFWKWLLEILLPRLYISKQWNNMPVDDSERRMIATRVAYRVGPVRIRQQRVRQEECNAVPMMYKFIETCSQEWSVTMEDDATYMEGWTSSKANHSTMLINYPWKHRSLFDDAGLPFSGEFGIYTGGGYIADLIGDRERAMKIAEGLMLNNWINQYTRAIFIEFTVYNPYVNMFSNVFIAFEMPTMGKMMIKESVKTFRLFSYLGGYGVFVVLCELSTLAIVIYFIVREVKVIKQQRKRYLKSFWNCLEIFNMICAVVAVSMYIVRHMITQLAMHSVKKLRDKFYNFQKVAMWDEVFGYFMAFTIFVSIIKLLHLFRFNKRMSMIAGTLKYSTKELSAFSVVIIILIVAFASWGYIMFGPKMFQYRNMFQSIETMLAFALGDFDYLALERVNRVFGPIYFFTFILCIMIVLLNVFVTILNESISAVKSDISKQSNEHEIVAFIWGRFKDWIGVDFDKFFAEVKRKYMLGSGKRKKKEKAEDIEEKLRDISKRLEQLGKYDASRTDHPPPDMSSRQMDDVTKELLFTRLFPTMKHQKITLH